MKTLKSAIIIFLFNSFLGYGQLYLNGTTTPVTNLVPNVSYYYNTTDTNSNKFYLKTNEYAGLLIQPNVSFSLTNSDITNFLNGTNLRIEHIKYTQKSCKVCVLFCHDPIRAEYKWVDCSTNELLRTNTLTDVFINATTAAPLTLTQLSEICSTTTSGVTKFQTNAADNLTSYKWYLNNSYVFTTISNISNNINVNINDVVSVAHIKNQYYESSKINLTVAITTSPSAPVITSNSVCINNNFTIEAVTNGDLVQWFEDANITQEITSGLSNNGKTLSYLSNFSGTKTLYARSKINTCFSNVSSINITTYPNPVISSITGENGSFCGNTASFQVNGTNISSVKWYSAIEGLDSQLISSNNPFNYTITNLLNGANKIYCKVISSNSCFSAIKEVKFNKIANQGTLSTTNNSPVCVGETVSVSLFSSSSSSYQWFEDQNMNIPISSSSLNSNGSVLSYITNNNNTGSIKYYYRGINADGCPTPLFNTTVIVNPKPQNLVVTNQNAHVCKGNTITFDVGANLAQNYKFYSNSLASIPITTGVSGNRYTVNTASLSIGSHSFWVKAFSSSGCESELLKVDFNVLDIPSNLSLSGVKSNYCSGEPIEITPIATNATSFVWSYNNSFNNLVEASKIENGKLKYIPSTNETTTYWVKGLNTNGCETNATSIEINVKQKPINMTITNNNGSICFGETIAFKADAVYEDSFKFFANANGTGQYTAPQVQNNILTLNSSNYQLNNNKFYYQAINVNGCNSELIEVNFNVKLNPSNLMITGERNYCTGQEVLIIPSVQNATSTNPFIWATDSNFNNLVDPSKINHLGYLKYLANDIENTTYYVKAINSNGCQTTPLVVPINVSETPKDLSVNNNGGSICKGQNLVFTVGTSTSGTITYQFWSNEDATIPITTGVSGNTYTVNSTTSSIGEYKFWVTVKKGNCSSTPIPVKYTILAQPLNLVATGATTYCTGEQILITPSAQNATGYIWAYDSNFNNIVEASKVDSQGRLNYLATTTSIITYYVKGINSNGCQTNTINLSINVKTGVSNLSVTNNNSIICQNTPVKFQAGATNAISYSFYQDENLTIPLTSGVSDNTYTPNTATAGIFSFWVVGNNSNGCLSQKLKVTYEIKTNATNLVVRGETNYCQGQTVLISPSAENATSFVWAYDTNFTELVEAYKLNGNNLNYESSDFGSTIYFVKAQNVNGCSTVAETITININETPKDISINNNGGSICKGQNLVFTVGTSTSGTKTYHFWSNDAATIPITTGVSGNTYTVNSTTSNIGEYKFWVTVKKGNCSSTPIPVKYSILAQPSNLEFFGNTTYCRGQQVLITPSALNSNTYQWAYDSNFNNLVENEKIDNLFRLNFISTQTGMTNYYLRALNSNGCVTSFISIMIHIKIEPTNLHITKQNPNINKYCKGTSEIYTASASNVSIFEWSKNQEFTDLVPNIMIAGTNSNQLNLNTLNIGLGVHNWYVRAVNESGCKTEPIRFSFEIIENVGNTVFDIENNSVCSGGFVNINLSNDNNNTTYVWYLNQNGSLLNTAYISNFGKKLNIPSSIFNVGNVVLYYKAINGICESNLTAVNFEIKGKPTNLNVTNNLSSVCKGEIIEFEASAENVFKYEFYKDINLLIPIDDSFISGLKDFRLRIPTANYNVGSHNIYLVAKSQNNCLSEIFTITFTVNDIPGPTSILGSNQYCLNSTISFNLLNSNTNLFKWFTDSNGLNQVNSNYISNNGASLNMPASQIGSNTLYYYAINSSGCKSAIQSINFTVLAAPSNINVSNNNINYCHGDFIDIVAGANNVINFEWYLDANGTTLVENINLFGQLKERYKPNNLAPGNYSVWVRGINISGCYTELIKVDFVVRIKPIINLFNTVSSRTIFIQGQQIIFNIDGLNYDRYKILKNGSNFIPNNNGYLTGNISQYILSQSATYENEGNYTLILSNGICQKETILKIIVIPQEIVITHDKMNNIFSENGTDKIKLKRHENIKFSTNINNLTNYTFKWTFGDGFENLIGSHYYNNTGEYQVKVKITNTTVNESFDVIYRFPVKVILQNDIAEINTTQSQEITLFPNPVIDNIHIKVNNLSTNYIAVIRIFNIEGITMYVEKINVLTGENNIVLNNPLLSKPTGTYFLKYFQDDNNYKQYTIIKR